MLLPLSLWIASGRHWDWLQNSYGMAAWAALCAFLMISSIATFSWGSLRLRRNVRFPAIVVIFLVAGALVSAPWETLSVAAILYLASIPFSIMSYARIRRQRAAASRPEPEPPAA